MWLKEIPTTTALTWVLVGPSNRLPVITPLFTSLCNRGRLFGATLLLMAVILTPASVLAGTGVTTEQFLSTHFTDQPKPGVLWINSELRQQAEQLLGHRFAPLRVRYWKEGTTSAWILDEIGKEMPITIGVVVKDHQLAEVIILEYRESRGGEVRHPFFTAQFKSLTLAPTESDQAATLNGPIDGITGATLSVNAVRKIATLALIFHQAAFAGKS
jgi:hypothetical protein